LGCRSGTIGLSEFVGLWGYLDQWRGLFRRFDRDGSGAIDRGEFADALQAFGYRLSDKFVNVLFASYDRKSEEPEPLGSHESNLGDGQISFDMFIQSMVTVKTLTEVFKKYDLCKC
jgi:Ca2+-binding EF-hand superfamily protein